MIDHGVDRVQRFAVSGWPSHPRSQMQHLPRIVPWSSEGPRLLIINGRDGHVFQACGPKRKRSVSRILFVLLCGMHPARRHARNRETPVRIALRRLRFPAFRDGWRKRSFPESQPGNSRVVTRPLPAPCPRRQRLRSPPWHAFHSARCTGKKFLQLRRLPA